MNMTKKFHESVEVYDGDTGDPPRIIPGPLTIRLDNHGKMFLKKSITFDGTTGDMTLVDEDGQHSFGFHGKGYGGNAGLWIGADKDEGPKAGYVAIRNSAGNNSIVLDGANDDITLVDEDGHRSLAVLGKAFSGLATGMWIGADSSKAGYIAVKAGIAGIDSIILDGLFHFMTLKDIAGRNTIIIDGGRGNLTLQALKGSITLTGSTGDIVVRDQDGKHLFGLHGKAVDYAGLWIGAGKSDEGGTKAGKIYLRSADGNDSIALDGAAGDIILNNADCAEDFDILESEQIEPGTVMIIEQEGKLRQSNIPYDKRVAGVISGAGDYKPGLVLDKKQSHNIRKSISLVGKVYCKVDAQSSPVKVGDLLTTSFTAGHAMKAYDPLKAFGAVIGKALRPLETGKGLIPILIALQ
jgi:hypothetical protein